jgi:hypothetical protein
MSTVPAAGWTGGPPAPRESTNAIVALVLAIGSFVVCPVVFAVVALVMCSSASREIEESRGWVTGSGLVTAARILAWINIALAVAAVVVGLLVVLVVGVSTTQVSG